MLPGHVDGTCAVVAEDSRRGRRAAMMERPPIWVISLLRAEERRRFVTEAFAEFGAPFELVEGVDGLELSGSDRRRYSHTRALFQIGRGLTRGDLGCSLSHLRLYERMVAESVPVLLIMEDDVRPTPDLFSVLDEIDTFPQDWDVVTLHSLFEVSEPRPIDDKVIARKYRICRYLRTPFGTQCYLITLAAARRALTVGYPVCMPPDELLFRRHPARLRVYGVEPRVVIEGDFRSELVARSGAVTQGPRRRVLEQPTVIAGKLWQRLTGTIDSMSRIERVRSW